LIKPVLASRSAVFQKCLGEIDEFAHADGDSGLGGLAGGDQRLIFCFEIGVEAECNASRQMHSIRRSDLFGLGPR
jgi:hypothetical protein